jgi:hypothetical protein
MDLILEIGCNVIEVFRLTPGICDAFPSLRCREGLRPEPDSSDAFNEGCLTNE